jgi:hypothetical protein
MSSTTAYSTDETPKDKTFTMKQLALIIKVQSRFRGFLTRKKARVTKYHAGMVGHNFVADQENYENEKVMEIRTMLGPFDFNNEGEQLDEDDTTSQVSVEARETILLENHAKYEGEWIIGEDIKQGKGT